MGLWDVLLFNIASVLGPRWIAAAAHNGTSSISLWILAAVLFFMPTSMIIVELSTRFPREGGLYIWTKEAFGDFHGFIAGWCYWIYTFFYFPGLLVASVAMSVYVGGPRYEHYAHEPRYLVGASLVVLIAAVVLNIVGLNIGKWLQNAGGVGTYVPLLMLVAMGGYLGYTRGSATAFHWRNILPHWDLDTVNFWSQIAFAFTGLELVCAMSEEVRNPRKTFPRATFGSGVLIALIYMLGTIALLAILPASSVDTRNGVFQAMSTGSGILRLAFVGILAASLVTVGNAGGVGATVAGVSRVPFAVGIDNYLPRAFGKIHPRWRTPWVAILVQAVISALILVLSQVNETVLGAYQILVDATIIIYFIPFLYMYAAAIKLSYRPDRSTNVHAVLIPGGKPGAWITGTLGFGVTAFAIVLSVIPPKEIANVAVFEWKVIGGTLVSILIGLILYARGARRKLATRAPDR